MLRMALSRRTGRTRGMVLAALFATSADQHSSS
jgi:hypothetical protein